MIGFYDYTVILTLVSIATSVFGMTQAVRGNVQTAIVCLALSGLMDAFDGKIARTKKNRSADETLYGIQLDSLADIVCFGIFPGLLCYLLGVRGILGGAAIGFYGICGVIRLAYFNVLETNRQMAPESGEKVYHGLPITSIAVILPLIYLVGQGMTGAALQRVLLTMLLVVGFLFILDFQMKKPTARQLAALVLLVSCALSGVLLRNHKMEKNASLTSIETETYDASGTSGS